MLKEGAEPRLLGTKPVTPPRHTDILIIGGGLVGTAVAYFMKSCAERMVDVTVVERDYAVSLIVSLPELLSFMFSHGRIQSTGNQSSKD